MIDITDIKLFYPSDTDTLEPRQHDRDFCDPALPLHNAIERLYSDRLKKRFTDVFDSDISQSSRAPRNEGLYHQFLELLHTHLPPRDEINVLEVGCGSGKFCQSLFERGYRTCGVDQSHFLLQQARQNAPGCEFVRASANVSFQDLFRQQFDAIVYLDAIEHLDSPRLFIERACESLAPGGLLILTARYRGYLINLPYALTEPTPSRDARFDQGASANPIPTTLGQLLKDFGLEIVEFQKAGRLPQPWKSQLFVTRKPVPVTAGAVSG